MNKIVLAGFRKVEQHDDGTLLISGIASTESVDSMGEIVKASAMAEAIPAFREWPVLREMHQSIAAGKVTKIEVVDGKTLIEAHVFDAGSVLKCLNGVLRGFSIGGKVKGRDSKNPKIITKLDLNEVSIVDKPACKDAILFTKSAHALETARLARLSADQVNEAMKKMTPEERAEIYVRSQLKFGRLCTSDWASTPGRK